MKKFAHFVKLEVIVVFALLQFVSVLVFFVAGVKTLFLRFELHSITRCRLLLLFSEKKIHCFFELIDLVDWNSSFMHFFTLPVFLTDLDVFA